jgi:hypothetical protein
MKNSAYGGIILLTIAYWMWESRASGNIRVDLLLMYPLLFCGYIYFLWPRFRWLSVLFSSLLMALNFGYFVMSYSWFHKHPG